MRRTLSLLALMLVLTTLVACASPAAIPTVLPLSIVTSVPTAVQPTAIPRGGEYKVAVIADAPTLHPFKRTDSISDAYLNLLYTRALWRYNPETLEPEPWAAESWTISEDRKTYTFKLRPMKWSDGKPVTAYDWQWTFEQAIKPENQWPYRSLPEKNISSFKALDEQTLEIMVKAAKPLPVALSQINVLSAILPQHIWEKYDWNDPTKNPEILHPSVVNGPYLLKEWKRDDHITFVRNDLYFQGPPNIDAVTYRIVPNLSISLQMLLNGEVDGGTINPNDFAKAKANDKLKLYQWDPAEAVWDYVGINLRRTPNNDVEFRHALSYATPRNLIGQKVYNDLSKPTYSTFPPTSWVYNPNVPKYDYNLETAKATLDKAGYKLDANGKRLDKAGKPIKLKLLHQAGAAASEKIALIEQEQFKQLGIELEIVALEGSAYLQAIKKEPFDWDLNILAWAAGTEPSDIRVIWSAASIPDMNRSAYINKRQEDLWDQAETEFDPAKRKAIYEQIQQILSEDSPYIFLVYRTSWSFQNKRIVPNAPTRLGINYDFAKWHIQ